MLRKKTLRRMPEVSRKVAKLIGELESVERRLKNLLPEIERFEHDSRIFKKHRCIDVVNKSKEVDSCLPLQKPENDLEE